MFLLKPQLKAHASTYQSEAEETRGANLASNQASTFFSTVDFIFTTSDPS